MTDQQLILIHDYAGHPFQFDLSREIARRGYRVVHGFYSGDAGPKGDILSHETDPDSFKVIPFDIKGNYNKSAYLSRRSMDIRYGKTVANWIVENSPNVVISGNTPSEAQEKVFAACRKVEAKFIPWVQDLYSVAVRIVLRRKLPFLGAPVSFYYKYLDKRHLMRSHRNILISDDFLSEVCKWGVPRIKNRVIPNWGALQSVHLTEKNNWLARKHKLNEKFVFLYSGTLGIKHRPDLLLDLAMAFAKYPDVVIVLSGQGRGYDKLKVSAPSRGLTNIRFLPIQSIHNFKFLLGAADVTVATLEDEAGQFAIPSKVLNYMCAGKPILLSAPKQNQASRLISNERLGIQCDEHSFVYEAQKLYEFPSLRDKFGFNARKYAERNFDLEVIASNFEEVF